MVEKKSKVPLKRIFDRIDMIGRIERMWRYAHKIIRFSVISKPIQTSASEISVRNKRSGFPRANSTN